MLESIFSSLIFEWIGASVKWLIFSIDNFFRGRRTRTIRFYFEGKDSKNGIDFFSNGVSNIAVGIISCVFLILLLRKILD